MRHNRELELLFSFALFSSFFSGSGALHLAFFFALIYLGAWTMSTDAFPSVFTSFS